MTLRSSDRPLPTPGGTPVIAAPPRGQRHRSALVLAALCLLVVLVGLWKGSSVPLWSDELATVHIAAAPTWHDMVARSRGGDLNPPLEPALVRLSMALFGPHEFAARLPSVLCFTMGLAGIFLFLRRRTSTPFALFGALVPLCNNEIRYYLTEARPYALLFAAVAVGVLAYDSVIRHTRPIAARVVLALAIVLMLQAHVFGLLAALAFVFAEALRCFRLRCLDPWTALAILLPFLSVLTYLPVLLPRSGGGGPALVYNDQDRTSLRKGLSFYHTFLYLPISGLFKVIVVVLLCIRFFPNTSFTRSRHLPAPLWTLLLLLLASPVLVTLLLRLHAPGSGFYTRYGIAAVFPACVLLASLTAWRAGDHRIAGWIFTATALALTLLGFREEPWHGRNLRQTGLLSAPPGVDSTSGVERICPNLALVMNNAHDFMEADYRLSPQQEPRLVYLTNPAESLRLEHENAGESISSMARAFDLPHHVLPSAPFLSAHRDFLVLARPGHHDWFLDSLQERHAAERDLGRFFFAGARQELRFVSLTPGTPEAACLAAITQPR